MPIITDPVTGAVYTLNGVVLTVGVQAPSTPPVETLTVATPGAQTTGVPFTVAGTYANATLTALDVAIAAQGTAVGSLTWAPVTFGTAPAGGVYSFQVTRSAALAGAVVFVRDHVNQAITASSGAFPVTAPVVQAPTPVLTLTAPSGVQAGASYTVTGSYSAEPATPSLQFCFDGAALAALPSGSAVGAAVSGGGSFSLMMPGTTAASHTLYVQDGSGNRSNTVTYTAAAVAPSVVPPSAGTLSAVAGDGQVTYTYTAGATGGAAITARTIYAGATQAACQANITAHSGSALTLGNGGTFTRTVANGQTEWVAVTATNSAGEGAVSNFAWGMPQAASSAGSGAETLIAYPPSGAAVAGQAFNAPAAYTGSTAPTAIDYSGDGGNSWAAANNLVLGGNGTFTYSGISGGAGYPAGLKIRDHNNQSIVSPISAYFTVYSPSTSTPDTLAAGIYFPDKIYVSATSGGYGIPMGSGLVRGLAGPPTITLSGNGGTNWYQNGSGLNIAYGIQGPAGTTNCTWTVADGTNTYTKNFQVINNAGAAVVVARNIVFDTDPSDSGTDNAYVTGYTLYGNTGAETFTDPSGLFSGGNGYIHLLHKATMAQHYGMHTVTMSFPTSSGTYSQDIQICIASERAPLFALPAVTLRSNLPALADVGGTASEAVGRALFGTLAAYSDTGIASVALSGATDNLICSTAGVITAAAPLTTGSNKTATTTILSDYGRASTGTLTYSVGQGVDLPTSDWTVAFSNTLDNTAGNIIASPVSVGTVTITSGLTNPTWSVIAQNESAIEHGGGTAPTPTFVGTLRAGNPLILDVTANFLSAGTYNVSLLAYQGLNQIRQTVALTVADVRATGPAVSVVRGATNTSSVFASWNEAMDAYWSNPATYKGMTLTMPGGVYDSFTTNDGNHDWEFNHTQQGHGSNQQFPPGPYTMKGPSPTNPTIITPNGAPGLSAQGGLIAVGVDTTFSNLVVRNVSNLNAGEGNSGALYKEGETPGNVSVSDCKLWNSDNCMFTGGCLTTAITLERCMFGFGGIGAGGLTHNAYIGHAGSVTFNNSISFSTAQVHEFKSRARITTITNSTLADGQNGQPGSSTCMDVPNGGIVTVTNTVMHKGPAPNNDGNFIQYGEESVGQNGPAHDVNTMLLDGVTFLNTAAPGSITSSGTAIAVGGYGAIVSPVTGLGPVITYKNCKFFNLPKDQWINGHGATVVDGGGNTFLTTWPGLQCIDPSTGAVLVAGLAPKASYDTGFVSPNGQGITINPTELETRIAANASIGTQISPFLTHDKYGVPLASPAWSLPSDQVNDGSFTINSSTGVCSVAKAGLVNGLLWIKVAVSGNDSQGGNVYYEQYRYIIVGTGYVPGRDTAGGPVTVA